MAPNISMPTGVLHEYDDEVMANVIPPETHKPERRKVQLVWRNIIIFAYLHVIALYGFYLMFTSAKLPTTIYALIIYQFGAFGITAGAHRLWSHKSFKVKLPFKLILLFFETMAYQNSVIDWVRDHRVHHYFTETDADPYNARRGFFFSHVGWFLCKKHPQVKNKGKNIDISDLHADPWLSFQHKYYYPLMILCCFILPPLVPMYLWNETFVNAFSTNIFRYIMGVHISMAVNSFAHRWGNKPYDRHINPSDNLFISLVAAGEGWHNYHHTWPWDYKTSELGNYGANWTTGFIDFFAKIGWAYDLKTIKLDMINNRVKKTGDGTRKNWYYGEDVHMDVSYKQK